MNINPLHLFGHYLPSTQIWVYDLIRNLPEAENHIAARHYLKNNFYAPEFKFAESYLDGVVAYNNELDKRRPVELFQKAVVHSLPFFLGSDERRLIRYARQHQIDVLHAHFAPVGWHYRKVAKQLGIPFIVSFYGYDYEMMPFSKPIFQKRYRRMFEFADIFICEGPYGASILEQMGCPYRKIQVVPLGVEVDKIPFFERDKKPGELKLVQVASFAEKKGHIYTVMAFAEALKNCPNMELTLVGNVREPLVKKRVLDFIAENELTEKIRVLGWLEYTQLHKFLGDFHVFIHPSCYAHNRDCEGGAPVIILDAQATGMPVIATEHCDIPFLVENRKVVQLAPEKDVQSLATLIKSYYWLPAKEFSDQSRENRQYVLENFNVPGSAKKLREVYEMKVEKTF